MKQIRIFRIIAMFMLVLTLQSCFVAKKYERPEVKTDSLYRTVEPLDSTSIASLTWEQLFTDPLLQAYIREGLQQNFDVKIGLQNLLAAEAYKKQGKAGYLPSLGVSASWNHQELAKNSQFGRFFDGALDQYELSGRLSWEADIWGKIRSNKRASDASYLQTVAAQQAIQTDLVAAIATTYYQLLALDAQIALATTTLENRKQSVLVIEALKSSGAVTAVAVKQTEAQMYATEVVLEDLQYQVQLMEHTLSILLGKGPSKIERSTFEQQRIDAPIQIGLPAYLLSKRPDVVAAELNFRNAFEMTNVARSNFYPSLTVSATSGFQSLELKDWFSTNSIFANVLTGLTQPIFNQRQIKTKYEVAKANQQKAYFQFEQALLTAGKEVSDALAFYENETKKMVSRKNQVVALQQASAYSEELLQFGLANYLEVLTAKDQALQSELSLIDNQFKQFQAVITLYKALGGGY